MPDRHSLRALPRRPRDDALVAAARVFEREQNTRSRSRDLFTYRSWQEEAWAFFESLGEFAWAVDWLVKALSRVRLTAAVMPTGGDEPEPATDGPAAEAVARLGAGIGGHSLIMAGLTNQLSVPGEGWLVGEPGPAGTETWRAYSTVEIRASVSVGTKFEVLGEDGDWRPLAAESFVTRVWAPSPKLYYEPHSSVRAALPVMRRIDLLDRRIVATLVSRLAMNGMLLIPAEGTLATPAKYQEADDPFVSMLIDIASNNIKNPGNASAAIPMPVRFSSDYIEKWKHLTFGDGIATELLEERDRELKRLATALNVPAEIITGLGDVNHWGAWQLEESAVKMHVSPMAEVICDALTRGYLYPMLEAGGATALTPAGNLIVWYDTSELTARPDRTEPAIRLYDRFELSGVALRRETGFGEGDAPDDTELQKQILKRLAATIQLGWAAMQELTGGPDAAPPTPPAGSTGGSGVSPAIEPAGGTPDGDAQEPRDIPDTQDNPPPPPGPQAAQAAAWPAFISPDLEPRAPLGAPVAVNGHGGKTPA
jgi:hypothetical protein